MSDPQAIDWLTKDEILAVHEQVLAAHGGPAGIRDHGLLESALRRPRHLASYGQGDLFDWAAAYAHWTANNHPFVDGNKRTAFVAAALFLESNGWRVIPPEEEVVRMMPGVADKSVQQEAVAQWLREQTEQVK